MTSSPLRTLDTLTGRVVLFLSLALLPLGMIAVFQTSVVVREADDLATSDMLSRTVEAATNEYALIRRAMGASNALGVAAMETGPSSAACSQLMERFVEDRARFIFAGFIQANGTMACASTREVIDFSGTEDWARFTADPRPMVSVNENGTATGQSVIIVSTPVLDEGGRFQGAASISIPHSLTDTLLNNRIDGLDVAILDGDGRVLSASTGIENRDRFERLGIVPNSMDIPRKGLAVNAVNHSGEPVTLALVELIETDLYVLGKWSENAAAQSVSLLGTAAPAFPVLMWLASLFVAYLAVDRLVLRHLNVLRRSMAGFSVQDAEASKVRLEHAPLEIESIARSYNALVARTLNDHGKLEAAVSEKEILLREVHHRVKNNLQLIASIVNMQMRGIDAPDARRVLARVQDRVMSLATIHKALYTDTQVAIVRVDEIAKEILQSLVNVSGAGKTTLSRQFDLEAVELDPDQAVPLCLLLTEAVTNAIKYVGSQENEKPCIWVSMRTEADGAIAVDVGNSRGPHLRAAPNDVADGTGLGTRLINAFVSQLGGISDVAETDHAYVLHVRFFKLDDNLDTDRDDAEAAA